jgi:hypothetical protein
MRNHRPGVVSKVYVDGRLKAISTVALRLALPGVSGGSAHTVTVVLSYGSTQVSTMTASLPRAPAA